MNEVIRIGIQSVFTTLSASNHSELERVKHDFYATDPQAVRELLKVEKFHQDILEPACGQGHISKVLVEHGYNVTSEDLIDRGYGARDKDFFDREEWHGDIITNPPYKLALEFVEHSIDIIPTGNKVAMFLKIQFLEGQKRRKFYNTTPPEKVYVFSKRTLCSRNGDFENYNAKAVCYCWFIWTKGFTGEPVIRWI